MKLLLDENLPHALRHELPGHDVYTVAYMKWTGIENGELLELAASQSFEALITNDRGLEYEQRPQSLPIAVVVLYGPASNIESLRPSIPSLLKTLRQLRPQSINRVIGAE